MLPNSSGGGVIVSIPWQYSVHVATLYSSHTSGVSTYFLVHNELLLTMKFNFAGIADFGNSHLERGERHLVSAELHRNDVATDTLRCVCYGVDTVAVVDYFRAHAMTGRILNLKHSTNFKQKNISHPHNSENTFSSNAN